MRLDKEWCGVTLSDWMYDFYLTGNTIIMRLSLEYLIGQLWNLST